MIQTMTKKTIPLLGDGDFILPHSKEGDAVTLANATNGKISVMIHAPKGERIEAIKIGDKTYYNPYKN